MTTVNYEIKDLFNSNYDNSCPIFLQSVTDETNRILNLACNEKVRFAFQARFKAREVAEWNLTALRLGKTLLPQDFHIGSQIF